MIFLTSWLLSWLCSVHSEMFSIQSMKRLCQRDKLRRSCEFPICQSKTSSVGALSFMLVQSNRRKQKCLSVFFWTAQEACPITFTVQATTLCSTLIKKQQNQVVGRKHMLMFIKGKYIFTASFQLSFFFSFFNQMCILKNNAYKVPWCQKSQGENDRETYCQNVETASVL